MILLRMDMGDLLHRAEEVSYGLGCRTDLVRTEGRHPSRIVPPPSHEIRPIKQAMRVFVRRSTETSFSYPRASNEEGRLTAIHHQATEDAADSADDEEGNFYSSTSI